MMIYAEIIAIIIAEILALILPNLYDILLNSPLAISPSTSGFELSHPLNRLVFYRMVYST